MSQNVYLESVSLGLGTVAIGAFSEDGVRRIAGMPDDERPLYLMPVGRT
jgi:nitroreductase